MANFESERFKTVSVVLIYLGDYTYLYSTKHSKSLITANSSSNGCLH